MFSILADPTYRRLFTAQVVALLGTGLATVALGLLAYDLAGGDAALVLGTAFSIKMVAYVCVAPVAAALAERLPRRAMLVGLDLLRGAAALALPFVTEIWQIYLLIFVLQAASAGFTPAFQATIPDVLTDEARYTRALSLSRLAYDLETLLSPALAALLLAVLPHGALFGGTAAGFAASALLILSVSLPSPRPAEARGFADRLTRGLRIYLATPRLRGLLALNLAAAAGGAMVLVNTVVLVRGGLGGGESAVGLAMALFGSGSMIVALTLPRLLGRMDDRPVMLAGGAAMAAALAIFALLWSPAAFGWAVLAGCWLFAGAGYAAVLTPSGRLLTRSSHRPDRAALFAAQFALSHLCWLLAYPLAGALMTVAGPRAAAGTLALLAAAATLAAQRLWPAHTAVSLPHRHDDLPPEHPHLRGTRAHAHPVVIDDLHPTWPRHGL